MRIAHGMRWLIWSWLVPKKNPFDDVPLYRAHPYGFVVYLATTRGEMERLQEWLSKGSADDLRGTGGACAYYTNDQGAATIVIGWFNKRPGTLAHECFHATMKIFHMCGIKFDVDNNEHFAYMLGDMVKYFWGFK